MLAMVRIDDAERRRQSLKVWVRGLALCMRKVLDANEGVRTQAAICNSQWGKARERSTANSFLPPPTHIHTNEFDAEAQLFVDRKRIRDLSSRPQLLIVQSCGTNPSASAIESARAIESNISRIDI